MNRIFVLKSKLIIPEICRSILLTERMKQLHSKLDSCRAATVSAPAGYGKTTLVLSYLNLTKTSSCRACWYRLDPEDKNLSTFKSHLVESLFPSENIEFAESRNALAEFDVMQSQPYHFISALCREIWARQARDYFTKTIIVLDDYQSVAQIQEINQMIKYMLDNLPPTFAIFVLSRAGIEVFTEKQKLEKNILEITTDNLTFDNDEIEELLLFMGDDQADKGLIEFIKEKTEGWVAGIIILYQAIKGNGPYIGPINFDQLKRVDDLFRYMSLEVLKSVGEEERDSLAKLSIIQEFSEADAFHILGIADIKLLMERCMEMGIFIQKIPGAQIVYRYHSLFREFLYSVLKETQTNEQITSHHLNASQYYMSNGLYGRAAEQLIKCGDSASAVDIVTKAGFNKFMIGETGQLKSWLDLLPDNLIENNSILLLFKAQLMPNSRQLEMIDTLKKVLKLSLNDNNPGTFYDAASVLIYIFMCSNNMKELLGMTIDIPAKIYIDSCGTKNKFAILELVRLIAGDNFYDAKQVSESVQYDSLPEDSKWLYLILSCIIYYCIGELEDGERCMRTALILNSVKYIEPSKGFLLLFLSTVMLLKNQREALSANASEIISIGQKYEYEYLSAHGKRLSAFDRYLSHGGDALYRVLDEASVLFNRINNKAMAASCRLLILLWSFDHKDSAVKLEEAKKEHEIIKKANPGMMIYESSLSILGAIARESGDFIFAEQCLLSAIKGSGEKGATQVMCGSLIHVAKLYYSMGNEKLGASYLERAMALGSKNKYFMFWDIHLPTITEVALRSALGDINMHYSWELLSKFYDNKTIKYLKSKIESMSESKISDFINSFVSVYKNHEYKHYFVKATLLGKPEIWVNGIKIPDTKWKTKKVKGFLEYLLLNCGDTLSRDALAEIFWPESGNKSAMASQRTALYSLRKILSQYDVDTGGSNAFICETPDGLKIRKNDAVELDIHEFLCLRHELYRDLSLGSQKEKELLEKMVSLYKGELMEGNDFGDLVHFERENFKSKFVEACQRLASIYTKCGEPHNAEEALKRAFVAEPLNENICLDLIKLYIKNGRKSKAVKLYYSFKKRLEEELGIKIDKRFTEAIRG